MQCLLCKNGYLVEVDYKKEQYYYCSECELIFIAPEYFPALEEEKARYDEHDNTHQNQGYVEMFEQFIEKVIIPFQGDWHSVLEFGCGPGPVLADLLKERGYEVDLYDPFYYPEKVYKNKCYDLITVTEVFEHLQDPEQVINRLVSHIKKGSGLAIMTSFHPGVENFSEWWYKWDPTHICFYNQTTFNWIAKHWNLEIELFSQQKYCLFRKK